MAQEDMHETVSLRIREKFEMSEVVSKLASYGDVRRDDESCYRFSPKNPDWPEACIYEDGRVFVIAESHFADEIAEFAKNLGEILGMEILDY